MKFIYALSLIVAIAISSCTSTATAPEKRALPSLVSTSETTVSGFEQKDIVYSTYIETTWGTGEVQWGDPIHLPGHSRIHFPPLAFSEKDEVYISDFSNRRLLKYDGNQSFPVQIITLPEQYYSDSPFLP